MYLGNAALGPSTDPDSLLPGRNYQGWGHRAHGVKGPASDLKEEPLTTQTTACHPTVPCPTYHFHLFLSYAQPPELLEPLLGNPDLLAAGVLWGVMVLSQTILCRKCPLLTAGIHTTHGPPPPRHALLINPPLEVY